jgi:nicotinamidase-related amidase
MAVLQVAPLVCRREKSNLQRKSFKVGLIFMLTLDHQSTALVLIDLQQGILRMPLAPHSAAAVVERAAALVRRFRTRQAPVVLVHVGWSADLGDALKQPVDRPMSPPAGGYPVDWMDFVPALEVADSDIIITKRQWGAFYGTELDLQLRRRGVKTIVLGGVSTNIGVESTARAAWEHGYGLVFAEDAMSSSGAGVDLHGFSIANILPRLGLVRQTSDILAALD